MYFNVNFNILKQINFVLVGLIKEWTTPSKEVSYRDKDVSVRSGRDKKSYSSDSGLACLLD
jgi:hypothetical protein